MKVRTRRHRVQRLTWGDRRRCKTGHHAYVMEQNAWCDADGVPKYDTRWKCWTCGHWQTTPPLGTHSFYNYGCDIEQRTREYAAKYPEEYARVLAEVARQTQGEQQT